MLNFILFQSYQPSQYQTFMSLKLPPKNFRPVPLKSGKNLPPKLFRSNNVDNGYDEPPRWLIQTIGIKSYIDLRQEQEFCSTSVLDKHFIRRELHEMTPETLSNDSEQSDKRYRYHIPIPDDYCKQTLIEFYYQVLVGYQSHLKILFSIMLNAKSFPILISCAAGKDRTGIVVALIMKLAGCSEDVIIKDYSLSEGCYLNLLSGHGVSENGSKPDDEVFHSYPQTMVKFLRFLKERFGGVEQYLKLCGLTEDEIDRIKKNLSS